MASLTLGLRSAQSKNLVSLGRSRFLNRELKQTTTTTATRTSTNKRVNKKNNSFARVINFCIFLCRPLQNNNVKWPSSASSSEHGGRRLIFRTSIWNWTPSLHISLKHVFRAIGVPNRSRNSRISLAKYKFIFYYASSSASSSSLLKLPNYSMTGSSSLGNRANWLCTICQLSTICQLRSFKRSKKGRESRERKWHVEERA